MEHRQIPRQVLLGSEVTTGGNNTQNLLYEAAPEKRIHDSAREFNTSNIVNMSFSGLKCMETGIFLTFP